MTAPQQEKVFDFAACNQLGAMGERIVAKALSRLAEWRIEQALAQVADQKRFGADYVATFGGDRGILEIKTDMTANQTQCLALERSHEMLNGQHKDGWLRSSAAKFLAFFVVSQMDVEAALKASELKRGGPLYVFSVSALRSEFFQWRQTYAEKCARNQNYRTWIVPVPIRVAVSSPAHLATYSISFWYTDSLLHAHATPWTYGVPPERAKEAST